jgi:hypothetical protein
MQTIAETGIDLHFIVWSLIFGTSIALFFWAARKIKAVRQLEANRRFAYRLEVIK